MPWQGDEFLRLFEVAEEVRLLQHEADRRVGESGAHGLGIDRPLGGGNDDQFDSQLLEVRLDHRPILRVHRSRHDDPPGALCDALGHENRLAEAGGPFVETGVGDIESRQLADQRLKLEERL